MARPLRIELGGGLYHVTARGDRREAIFFDDDDRIAWLTLLGEVCERFNWRCHAFCQMTNHYHLVIETPDGNLSRGMRQLNGVYTQHINRRYRRVGHLFQGRYKGILVERDSYLLELARYVVLNPVRAGMVADAGDWPWSSHAMMIGQRAAPAWLETDWLLGQFSAARPTAIAAYRDFVRAGVGLDSVWTDLRQQAFLGSERFVADMQRRMPDGDLREVPRMQRRGPARPLAEYAALGARNQAMAAAYHSGDYTMKQIADYFGVHYATVSRAVRREGV
ncbi:MAG TPA: transposase [Gammaproteobacteria bacterium]|nr:transposase [Gammaproteobacteria bacterium]